uniref:Progonadoliberin n=1 Tax=Halocynthia roretzi TaxID=7729 RepID=J7M3X0_HALRO|nr:preprogonadotropin-releasing hormone [Halocynthia roretzi]BAN09213.1 preprogonadotropin-releasing hormone [Halocynthia roretzi]
MITINKLAIAGILLCVSTLTVEGRTLTSNEEVPSERSDVMNKRQHWSYGFSPGGKREFESNMAMTDDTEKRENWPYEKFIPAMQEIARELQKRQHWSYGFLPGGKRSGVIPSTEYETEELQEIIRRLIREENEN